jgi:hypothetical protein
MTRSYGFTIEPTTHTGLLGSYRFNDYVSMTAGIANTFGPSINERAHGPNAASDPNSPTMSESYKTYMASVALTAPDDWGWVGGSTLYAGIINGFSSTTIDTQTHYYLGGTLATPVTGLKVGLAVDWLQAYNYDNAGDTVWSAAGYASYQATEKLSFHGRMEYLKGEVPSNVGDDVELFAITGTVQYDLWENVISRLEIRWDRCMDSPLGADIFGGRILTGGGDFEEAVTAEGFNVDPDGFEDYHTGSTAVGNVFGSVIGGGVPAKDESNDSVLIALQFIYKF